MKEYIVVTIFYHDQYTYCLNTMENLLNLLKMNINTDATYFIEKKYLSEEMIKKLNITYFK